MKFSLIDRIVELSRGERIVAVKAVSLAEEYLADHFPKFPVLPGVLMLEAMVEAAAWLVRDVHDFSSPIILLRYAKNVTYKNFVRPGQLLTLTVTCRRLARDDSDFDGVGHCVVGSGRGEPAADCQPAPIEVVRARFGLTHVGTVQGKSVPAPVVQHLAETAREKLADLRR